VTARHRVVIGGSAIVAAGAARSHFGHEELAVHA
jgi:hypothetical protein